MSRIHVGTTLLVALLATASAMAQDAERLMKAATTLETVDGNLPAAIAQYKRVVASGNRALAAQALYRIAECHRKLGDARARSVYEQLVREYADQPEAVARARARLRDAGGAVSAAAAVTPRMRTVWQGDKVDLFGQVSSDGRWITFTDWAGGGNLVVHDTVTKTDRPLTNKKSWAEPGNSDWSAISKDGTQVAYGWSTPAGYELRVLPMQVSTTMSPRTVLAASPEVAFLGAYDWSPDGRSVAIGTSRKDGTGQIGVVDVQSGTQRTLKSVDWHGPERIYFSRDGRFLAYDGLAPGSDTQRDIYVMAVDGSREVPVVVHAADDQLLGWTPDGSRLLFTSDRTGSVAAWSVQVVDGSPRGVPELLRADVGNAFSLGITDAGAVYIYKDVSTRDIRRARVDLKAGRIVGGMLSYEQGFTQQVSLPFWSPDGTKLAAQSCAGKCIVVRDASTGASRVVPIFYTREPRWSPDGGSFIAAARDRRGRNGIFRIDVTTGQPSLVVLGPGFNAQPQWLPDGASFVYRHGPKIMTARVDGGEPRELASVPRLRLLELSPDGRNIAYLVDAQQGGAASLWVMPVSGGQARQLLPELEAGKQEFARGLAWVPGSDAVLVARKAEEHWHLWRVPADGQPATRLEMDESAWPPDAFDRRFTLSPDGSTLAFLHGTTAAEVWALEGVVSTTRARK